MLNLIKNELIKLFNKKAIYIMILLIVLFSFLSAYVSKRQIKNKDHEHKITLSEIEDFKQTEKADKEYLKSLIQDYVIQDILENNTIKPELKNYYKNNILKNKFNYYSMKITEEYLTKKVEINKTISYNELKNYILSMNKEDIKNIIKNDLQDAKNNHQVEIVKLLSYYEKNNIDFKDSQLVNQYNILYNHKVDSSYLDIQIKEVEKNIKNVNKENQNTRTYKLLNDKLKNLKTSLKKANLNIKVIEEKIKTKKYSNDKNLLVEIANNSRSITLFFLLIGMIAISSTIVSEEYSKSTIKLLLIRPYSRSKILLAKYITTLISMFILLGVMFVASIALNYVYNGGNIFNSLIYGNIIVNKVINTTSIMYFIKLTISFIPMILMYTTLAFFISVLTMSSSISNMLSFGVFFLSQIFESLALYFNFYLIKYSFTVVSDYTSYVSTNDTYNTLGEMINKFNLTTLEQNITYVIYIVLFLVISFLVFKKRDIKNI